MVIEGEVAVVVVLKLLLNFRDVDCSCWDGWTVDKQIDVFCLVLL